MVFQSLRLSHASLRESGIGQMINLISSDAVKLETITEAHFVWVGPIQVCIFSSIVWYHFGPSCIIGLLSAFLLAIFQGTKKSSSLNPRMLFQTTRA